MADKKFVVEAKIYKGQSSVVSARIPVDLIRKIDDIAERTGRTRNEIMLACLEFAVDNIEIKE